MLKKKKNVAEETSLSDPFLARASIAPTTHNTFLVTFRRTVCFHALSFEKNTEFIQWRKVLWISRLQKAVFPLALLKSEKRQGFMGSSLIWPFEKWLHLSLALSIPKPVEILSSPTLALKETTSKKKKKTELINFWFLFPIVYLSFRLFSLMPSSPLFVM